MSVQASNDHRSFLLFRGAIIGGGIFGIVWFARKSRLFSTYERVSQIPSEMFTRGIEMKGIVRAVHPNGLLKVEHKPIIRLPSIFSRRKYGMPGLIDVRLAGITVSDSGSEYISRDLRLRSSSIIFTAIRTIENNTIDAEIYYKKKLFFQTNLNVDLVRRGYAKVLSLEHDEHVKALKTLPVYSRLMSKLIMSEKIADRRGLGLWRRDTWAETIVSYPSMTQQIVSSSAPVRILMSLIVLTKQFVFVSSRFLRKSQKVLLAISIQLYQFIRQLACSFLRISSQIKYKIDKYTSK